MPGNSSKSWLPVDPQSPFSLANLPFGIISRQDSDEKVPAVALGEHAVDLRALSKGGAFSPLSDFNTSIFDQDTLNSFAELGRPVHRKVRTHVHQLLLQETSFPDLLRDSEDLKQKAIVRLSDVSNHLPLRIGDYTDFYAGLNHAYNVGVLFRGESNALQPNYKRLPVGYHGRASSVQVSGAPVRRPNGQIQPDPTAKTPIFSPCKKLDIEVELAAFVCKSNELGSPIKIDEAEDYIFGYVLMNDWSARDIQAWEYVPLGPFNSKNFATTISSWVVLADALEPFKIPAMNPEVHEDLLPYLRGKNGASTFDIRVDVALKTSGEENVISRINASNLLYSFSQMLTHHTVTGCNMNAGDLLGSGTISGTIPESLGSLLEMTKNGKQALKVTDQVSRTFLQDGDEVNLLGVAGVAGSLVGFGDCKGTILPAYEFK